MDVESALFWNDTAALGREVRRLRRDRARLVGVAEVAALAGVKPRAVVNWRRRYRDFPRPLIELRMGPVFDGAAVRRWLADRRLKDAVPFESR